MLMNCRLMNMEARRMAMALVAFLAAAVVDHVQAEYACSASIKELMPFNAEDPCANSTAYSQLGLCSDYINGNVTVPSVACCTSVRSVWSQLPACFCKVTFFSVFSDPGPTRALARPQLCNITDDLCVSCPNYVSALHSESSGHGHSRKLNTASVVTVSVIVTLAVVGCAVLAYCIRKRALKKKQSAQTSKEFVPHVNSM